MHGDSAHANATCRLKMISDAERKKFLREMVAWRAAIPRKIADVERTIRRFDPMLILAFGLCRYALKDPDTYQEPQHFSVAPLEHVAALYAKRARALHFESFDLSAIERVFDNRFAAQERWADRRTSSRSRCRRKSGFYTSLEIDVQNQNGIRSSNLE
jgi:hypothetical protein